MWKSRDRQAAPRLYTQSQIYLFRALIVFAPRSTSFYFLFLKELSARIEGNPFKLICAPNFNCRNLRPKNYRVTPSLLPEYFFYALPTTSGIKFGVHLISAPAFDDSFAIEFIAHLHTHTEASFSAGRGGSVQDKPRTLIVAYRPNMGDHFYHIYHLYEQLSCC